ncbi:MAG: isochorismatase family protein [Actinomycetota bacterium]
MTETKGTALLVIDVQKDVVELAHDRDGVVAAINTVVTLAREAEVPVIWVQHDDQDLPADTDGWQIVDELTPAANDPIVRKNYRDAFESTDLADHLSRLAVDRLVVTGAQSDYCVRWTLHGALGRGFDTVLVSDGHTTDIDGGPGLPSGESVIAHTNQIWATQDHPKATASVVGSTDVEF